MPTPPWDNSRSFVPYNNERIVNYPLRVYMHGMEGTTQTLQHAGWSLSMKQDVYAQCIQLAMHHEKLKLFALSAPIGLDFIRLAHDPGNVTAFLHRIVFVIEHLASRMEVVVHEGTFLNREGYNSFAAYSPVDCVPQIETVTRKSIEDFMIFRPLNHTKSVIVDPNDVPGLMAMILKAQSPQQEEIRARQRSRENMAYVIDAGLMPTPT